MSVFHRCILTLLTLLTFRNLRQRVTPLARTPSTSLRRSGQALSASNERGQTTAEYALVLLAAGTIAMLAVAWAQNNGAIGGLLDTVIDKVTSLIE